MGLLDFLKRGGHRGPAGGRGLDELARRLGVREDELHSVPIRYRQFSIPKRAGGERRIAAPEAPLKAMQRCILRRLLGRLSAHPAATGFERGYSIVSNAFVHAGKEVVVRMDLKDFFRSTPSTRVRDYFISIGWSVPAADLLTKLCTHEKGLPQGAPTSPRLSNLVNQLLDSRLAGIAESLGASYTRYADDMTFSLKDEEKVPALIRLVKIAVDEEGYELHQGRKLRIRRRHQQQLVTGLVVNERPALPRHRRRWLRAVEHRVAQRGKPTLTEAQLAGWMALASMVTRQREEAASSESQHAP